MGVRIFKNELDTEAFLYCSTTEFAFGNMFREFDYGAISWTASELAQHFIDWLPTDSRRLTDDEFAQQHADFIQLLKEKKICQCYSCEHLLDSCDGREYISPSSKKTHWLCHECIEEDNHSYKGASNDNS